MHASAQMRAFRELAVWILLSMQHCRPSNVLSGAAVHAGSWAKTGPQLLNVEAHWAPACARGAAWQWAPSSCHLPTDEELPSRICRPGRTVLFVGDSFSRIAFEGVGYAMMRASLTCRVVGPHGNQPFPPPWFDASTPHVHSWTSSHGTELLCDGLCNETKIVYLQNDFLCVHCNTPPRNFAHARKQFSLAQLASEEHRRAWLEEREEVHSYKNTSKRLAR